MKNPPQGRICLIYLTGWERLSEASSTSRFFSLQYLPSPSWSGPGFLDSSLERVGKQGGLEAFWCVYLRLINARRKNMPLMITKYASTKWFIFFMKSWRERVFFIELLMIDIVFLSSKLNKYLKLIISYKTILSSEI